MNHLTDQQVNRWWDEIYNYLAKNWGAETRDNVVAAYNRIKYPSGADSASDYVRGKVLGKVFGRVDNLRKAALFCFRGAFYWGQVNVQDKKGNQGVNIYSPQASPDEYVDFLNWTMFHARRPYFWYPSKP